MACFISKREFPLPVISLEEQLKFAEDGIECSGVCSCGEYSKTIQYFTIKRMYYNDTFNTDIITSDKIFITMTDIKDKDYDVVTFRHPKKWKLPKIVKKITT